MQTTPGTPGLSTQVSYGGVQTLAPIQAQDGAPWQATGTLTQRWSSAHSGACPGVVTQVVRGPVHWEHELTSLHSVALTHGPQH